MSKNDYLEKMESLLNDESTYKKLKKNPIKQLTTKTNALIKSWRDNDLIDDSTYKSLNITNGNLPRCYGLPKVHKKEFPLRIIVSSLGSPVYNVAKYIHNILHSSNLLPKSHVKDGWTFSENLKDTIIDDNNTLISLDVTALYTNIPKELVLRAIEKRWSDISQNTNFSRAQFLYAVEFILDSTSFSFNEQYYEQIFGSPMGSPLSPILADMVMDDLETQCLSQLSFNVPTYYRYVDDIFAIIPKTKIHEIIDTFNNYHHRLTFTFETESDGCLNFLNTTISRSSGKLVTNWYRKETCSNRYINFFSNHPFKYKMNTIFNLVDHAILLSNDQFHNENINIVKQILFNNCFPKHVIDRWVKKRINFLKHRNMNESSNERNIVDKSPFISLPYVNSLGDIDRIFKNIGFNVVHNVPKKPNHLITLGKDRLPTDKKTEVVYKINCKDCNVSYIGQTKRHLCTRVKEHFSNIKMHSSNLSVISKHKIEFDHDFDWTSPVILHSEKHVRKREIAEMFFIKGNNNAINLQKDTDNLSNIYDRIIKVV